MGWLRSKYGAAAAMCACLSCLPSPSAPQDPEGQVAAVVLEGVQVVSRREDALVWTAQAARAEGDSSHFDLTDVTFHAPQGHTLRAPAATWRPDVAGVSTLGPVTLEAAEGGGKAQGMGMILDGRTGDITWRGPIEGEMRAPQGSRGP